MVPLAAVHSRLPMPNRLSLPSASLAGDRPDAVAAPVPVMDHELQSLSLTRVDQVPLRAPVWVTAQTDIVSVAREFQARRIGHVLVRGLAPSDAPGIFTSTGLQRAILDGRPLAQLPVGDLASQPLVAVAPDAPLVEALTAMIRHRVQRLVVIDPRDGRIFGVLEQVDLLSVLSNHSSLLTRQMLEGPRSVRAEAGGAADHAGHRPAAPWRQPRGPDRPSGAGAQRPAVPALLAAAGAARAVALELPVRDGQ